MDEQPDVPWRVFGGVGSVAALVELVRAGLTGRYATDEYTYAHAAWSIAQGREPYRDFFLHHFPLSMQLGSLVFRLHDAPDGLQWLRCLMIPIWTLAVGGLALGYRRHSPAAAWVAVPLMAGFGALAQYGTQFRPDVTALGFFALCLAVGSTRGRWDRPLGFLSGLAWTAAVWGSQKVLVYGCFVPAAAVLDITLGRASGGGARLLGRPFHWWAGALVGALVVGLYLTATDNWQPWVRWCYDWGIEHEKMHRVRSIWTLLQRTRDQTWHVALLGGIGVLLAVRGILNSKAPSWHANPELLWVLAFVGTAASVLVQHAPYSWSLLPPLAFTAVFAARAIADLYRSASKRWPQLRVLFLVMTMGLALFRLAPAWSTFSRAKKTNVAQQAALARIDRMTSKDDPIYDNTGMYVARPDVDFFFFTDDTVRKVMGTMLVEHMPEAILSSGATVAMRDARYKSLPEELGAFVAAHFVDVGHDILLWGTIYRSGGDGVFVATRDDRYYVSPEAAAAGLTVDGAPVANATFHLSKGEHAVSFGDQPSGTAILWQPRDGVMPVPVVLRPHGG